MENLQIWDEILYEIERFSEVYRFQDLDEQRRGADLRDSEVGDKFGFPGVHNGSHGCSQLS